MHFGETSVFIAIASVLHAMTIKPALDELGKPSVGPTGEDVKMKKGFLTYVCHPGSVCAYRSLTSHAYVSSVFTGILRCLDTSLRHATMGRDALMHVQLPGRSQFCHAVPSFVSRTRSAMNDGSVPFSKLGMSC